MTHIHYKFSSKLSYDTVVFDGPYVTLRDLKRQIMVRERLRARDCDLQITSSQNKEEYTDDECLIPKGTSVIVRRIPVIGARPGSSSKNRNIERTEVQPHHAFGGFKAMNDQNSSSALPFFAKMANLADADVSEEDKIKVVINQSNYDSMNYKKKSDAVLAANYTCFRCGNTGHHIKNCPSSGDKNFEAPLRIKKSTGIPRSFMVEVDSPNIKGAMLTNCGRYAIPSIDIEAYSIGKKEKPPFVPQEERHSEDKEDPVPEELLCLICHELLSDAVLIPCCKKSYCDDCIRTALLDSEEHVCPTCNQADVSPDTLISNTFLRQAVDNFQKERVTKTVGRECATTRSQNPTQRPSLVSTPPPLTVQRQPQAPQLSAQSQQDPLLHGSQAAATPPSSQVCGAPPTGTGPTSAPSMPSTSLQPVQNLLEIPDNDLHKAAEEKTQHDSATAATQSVPVSPKGAADAPSLLPLVELTPVVKQPQKVSVDLQQPSSGPAPGPSGLSTCWDSSSSSSGCRSRGMNKSAIHPPSISSFPATPPPLFPSPHFHSFLTAQQPLSSYTPGYPPPTPMWTIPNLQGAPIPSLCPSTPIPALIPKEWYMHKRRMKERSPHRGSSHRSSSRSNSKSSKSKSSRSYSRSSSRSRSRSRSKGRSRPRSPYSRHRDHHTRSRSSLSYSYGYKRSPTPSSSSSPQVGYRSRSPSDHRRNSHHSRHHRKSASSSSSSRRRGEHDPREVGGSGWSSASHLYTQHTNQSSSLEPHKERYLQWKREYKEWCDKYFSSYVGHFHQLPVPLLSLPPPPLHWGDREGSRNNSHADSRIRPQGRRSSQMDGRSPPSQSSSDSRSPPSQSSSDSRSPPSQSSSDSRSTSSKSSSDSRSSPSRLSNDSRSPPSQSSSDGRSTPSEDGAQPREYQQRNTEKYSRLPITRTKRSKEMERQEKRKDDKQQVTKTLEDPSTLTHEQKSMNEHEEGRGGAPSCPDAADSMDYCRNDMRRHSTGPDTCKDGTPSQDKATANNASESAKIVAKSDERFDKDYGGKSRDQRYFEIEKGERRGKRLDSRWEVGRRHKEKPSKASDGEDRHRYPAGSRVSDSRSEGNRKRKGEDIESNYGKTEKSKCLKTNTAEDSKTCRSKSLSMFARNKPTTEKKKERPLTEKVIWEGGMKVKPQKKISININLEGKRKEEKTDKQNVSYLESIPGKTNEETEKAGNKEEEMSNTGGTEIEANEKKESSRDQEGLSDEKLKADEGETRQKQEKATITNDKGDMLMEIAGQKNNFRDKKEDGEEEDFDLWLSALGSVVEEENKNLEDEREVRMQVSTGDEVLNMRGGKEGQVMGELVADMQKNKRNLLKPEEELMEGVKRRMRSSRNQSHHDRPNPTEDDRSYEDHEEKRTMVKTLEEFTQDEPADQEDALILIQVPRSKREKEEPEEEEPDEATIKVQRDALETFLPAPAVPETAETTTSRKTKTEEKRERADRESLIRRVAPSSGKSRTASSLCIDGEKSMEKERDRERERPRDGQKEKRSKERTREEEKRSDREKVRGYSSNVSTQKRNPSSSSQSSFRSPSHDTKRRDDCSKSLCLPDGKFTGGRNRESSATGSDDILPNQNVHKSCRDTILDSIFKDKIHPHSYYNHQDPSGNHRSAESYHSPPSRGQDRDPLASWSELVQPRASSPALKVMQSTIKNVNQVEKDETKLRKRENQDMVAERGGGSRWEEEDDESDRQTKWEGRRELEEGEKPTSSSNSVSSSASQESDGTKERMRKQKTHKKEKRRVTVELQEEGEMKKHKYNKKKSSDRREEVDNKCKEEAKLCSATLS